MDGLLDSTQVSGKDHYGGFLKRKVLESNYGHDNIVSIVRRPDTGEILVLTGLAHDGGHRGAVLSVKRSDAGVWSIKELVDLPSAPRVHVIDNEDGLLISTPRSIVRLSPSDELEELAKGQYDSPYTLVIAPNGDTFVGLRFFVLRLRPNEDGYEQGWFIPPECSNFHYEDVFCVCDGIPIGEQLKSLLEETRRIK